MAAIQEVRLVKWRKFGERARADRFIEGVRRKQERGHKIKPLRELPGMKRLRPKLLRVIATTPEETSRSGFVRLGDRYSFVPSPSDPIAYERLRAMSYNNIGWLWNAPKWGIRSQLFYMGHDSTSLGRLIEGGIGALNARPEIMFDIPQLADFVLGYWLPVIVLKLAPSDTYAQTIANKQNLLNKMRRSVRKERKNPPPIAESGLFSTIGQLRTVAAIYGLLVDDDLKADSWIRPVDRPAITETQRMENRLEDDVNAAKRYIETLREHLSASERDILDNPYIVADVIKEAFPERAEEIIKILLPKLA